mgnify:CR=1 FL=1
MFAVADTCFLIDWARFGLRDLLFGLFEVVMVPEQVLAEVRSEDTLRWLAREMGREKLQLFTPTPRQLEEAQALVRRSYAIANIRKLDIPEALCLVIGREFGYVVLTENRGALMIREVVPELSGVVIWRSLEVLKESMKKGLVEVHGEGDVRALLDRYQRETLHIFPEEDLENAIREVLKYVPRGG